MKVKTHKMRKEEWGFVFMIMLFVIIYCFIFWMAAQAGPMGEIRTNLAKTK